MRSPQSKREESVDILREEFLQERAAVLGRAGRAVEDVIAELDRLDQEIQIKKEQLQVLMLDEEYRLEAGQRQLIVEEINIDIEQFNVVVEKAKIKYYYLIVTREAMGLRRHKMIQEMYVIPAKKKEDTGLLMDRYRKQRARMVETQIKARGVTDARVLAAMEKVPRHLFVDEGLINQAYSDNPLPIGERQTISQPYIVALMTQELELKRTDRVLEIGTGSGYQAAILAELAGYVFSIERIAALASRARRILDQLNYYNVAIRVGDGSYGWKEESPFEAIITTAAAPAVPKHLIGQLAIGGRLIAPIGERDLQTLYKLTRLSEDVNDIKKEYLCDCRFVSLIGESGWKE